MSHVETETSQVKALIKDQQLKLLYSAVPNSLLASLFGCVVAGLIFNNVISPYRIYPWVVLMIVISAIRFKHFLDFRRAKPDLEHTEEWFVRFRIGTLLLAFAVGSAGLLLFTFDDGSYQMLLALMMVCICAFSTTTLAPHRPIAVAFLLIGFLPMILMVYFLQTEVTRYISLILILLTIMLILSSFRIHKTITESITLSIEAKYREEQLQNYEQRLSMFVEETPLAVIEWGLDKTVQEWNPAAEAIFGYKQEEVNNFGFKELLYEQKDESMDEMWDDLFHKQSGQSFVQQNKRKNGALILCEWINTPLINAENDIVGVMSLIQDVTQRIANEKLKNEFVSIVSHELRTPVTSIKAGLGLLSSGVLDDDRVQSKQMLDIALSNTNRLQMLINDILDVDKLESGKMEYRFSDSNLNKLIEDVLHANQSFAMQYGIKVKQVLMDEECLAHIDPDRIFQVLTNVLSNAIKFSESDKEVTVSVDRQGEGYRLAVNNWGEIIPESDREHMFSKFFQRDSSATRQKGGTGLGLYICQKILLEHGSSLHFESTEQAGTTFYFDLK